VANPNQPASLALATEAAFATGAVQAGQQIAFNRIRVKVTGLDANTTYVITHPYGKETLRPTTMARSSTPTISVASIQAPRASTPLSWVDASDRGCGGTRALRLDTSAMRQPRTPSPVARLARITS
jgi:hypothetical protein